MIIDTINASVSDPQNKVTKRRYQAYIDLRTLTYFVVDQERRNCIVETGTPEQPHETLKELKRHLSRLGNDLGEAIILRYFRPEDRLNEMKSNFTG